MSQANLDTLQKAVGEIRKDLAQKKTDGKADGTAAANNSTPNLSPTGGTTTARDDSRTGTEGLLYLDYLARVANRVIALPSFCGLVQLLVLTSCVLNLLMFLFRL